jgi:hypothetical protein
MRRTMFTHQYADALTSNYPDRLYYEANKIKSQNDQKETYIAALIHIETLGDSAPYWVIKAKFDLLENADELATNNELKLNKLNEIVAILSKFKISLKNHYGEFAFSLYQQYKITTESYQMYFWLLEAIKAGHYEALKLLPDKDFRYGPERKQVFVNRSWVNIPKHKLLEELQPIYPKVILAFLVCHHPKVYFAWSKHSINDDKDRALWFTANINPQTILNNLYDSDLDLIRIFKEFYQLVSNKLLTIEDWIDALDCILTYSNQDTKSADSTLGDGIKDWFLYMRGTALLQTKQRDIAKASFESISNFNQPLYAEANLELGNYYMAEEYYLEALKHFNLVLEYDAQGKVISRETVEENISALKGILHISENEDESSQKHVKL